MTNHDSTDFELTEQALDSYIDVAFAGAKNYQQVTPREKAKLRGLMKYYAKKPHPFTSCVRDNTKRFGKDRAERICAVLKDLIKGTTKWRGHEGKKLSESTLNELFGLEVDELDVNYILELADELVIEDDEGNLVLKDDIETDVDLATGDVAWTADNSLNELRKKVELALNGGGTGYDSPGYSFWVDDLYVNPYKALVCEKGKDYYVVPFNLDKKSGEVSLAAEEEWQPVERAWIETNLAQEEQILAEMNFADKAEKSTKADKDGFIWKTIMREGKWKFSPESGTQRPIAKPITVVAKGLSDPKKLIISLEEIKKNFDAGAVEHVTVPTSHADKVLENTGYVRKLKLEKDEKGRMTLKAALDFTEPDVKEKAERGTIANTSAGILFDYIGKESGKKFNAVIAHAALTNHPWLNGMKPFSEVSDNMRIIAFSEETETTTEPEGGAEVDNQEKEKQEPTFLSEFGLSEEEARERLVRYEEIEKENRTNRVNTLVKGWEDKKIAPALVAEAKTLLSAAAEAGTATVLNLSEDGKTVGLSAEAIVTRIMEKAPGVNLATDIVTDEQVEGQQPDEEAKLSDDEKRLVAHLFLFEGLTEEEAVAEAKKRQKAEEKQPVGAGK